MGFSYQRQNAVIQFDPIPDLPRRLEAIALGATNQHLNVNRLMSNDQSMVLQSATSSTLVNVNAHQALARTQYFGDFLPIENEHRRSSYTLDKLTCLLSLLEQAGCALRFVGIVTALRLPVADSDRAGILARVLRHLPGLSRLAGDAPIYDFDVRASHAPDQERFITTQLLWYEERVFDFQPSPGGPAHLLVRDWELNIDSQGLEFRFDQNNKQALLRGNRDWSKSHFLAFITRYNVELNDAVQKLQSALKED